ncbi:MAG: hypothetical protein Q4G49_07615 [Paracoccus sp. (in: a-proteobacteria)]|nr:hypothetical protein [Paracoccus sp. (in: a-proteobacteria)]
MISPITPPFIPEVLHEIDRNASFAMCYGVGLARVQLMLDPDLHNPVSAELLLLQEEQRKRREEIKTLPFHLRYSTGPKKLGEIRLVMTGRGGKSTQNETSAQI